VFCGIPYRITRSLWRAAGRDPSMEPSIAAELLGRIHARVSHAKNLVFRGNGIPADGEFWENI